MGDRLSLAPEAAQLRRANEDLALPAGIYPYDKWLTEEVVYIITLEERAAFLALKTGEERSKFVEQFWERRNPNPGSPENAFKEEHYRRIVYANVHWATDKPGWMSDRGRIYIVFGPPDEIDDHDAGPPYGYEQWRYKHAAGLGDNVVLTFADPRRDGSFTIVPGPPVMMDSPTLK